jgi:hypothetical protein
MPASSCWHEWGQLLCTQCSPLHTSGSCAPRLTIPFRCGLPLQVLRLVSELLFKHQDAALLQQCCATLLHCAREGPASSQVRAGSNHAVAC